MKKRPLAGKILATDIPDVVIQRLPLYARALGLLAMDGVVVVSSFRLGDLLGSTPAQIRKDLSYFGRFGKQGTGYNVSYLLGRLKQILGLEKEWSMALVGVGRLGQAIARYPGFSEAGFRMVALFDTDPEKIDKVVEGIAIRSVEEVPQVLQAEDIRIAILAVPGDRAQAVTELLLQGGARAILNYAPVSLKVPPDIVVRSIDPVLALQSMTFYLNSH